MRFRISSAWLPVPGSPLTSSVTLGKPVLFASTQSLINKTGVIASMWQMLVKDETIDQLIHKYGFPSDGS